MGKRKSAKAPPKKAAAKLDSTFNCPFCNSSKSVHCQLDNEKEMGDVKCNQCKAEYSTRITHLTEPIEWVVATRVGDGVWVEPHLASTCHATRAMHASGAVHACSPPLLACTSFNDRRHLVPPQPVPRLDRRVRESKLLDRAMAGGASTCANGNQQQP